MNPKDKQKIFVEIAIESGMNPDSVRKFYYSMIRVMVANLRKNEFFEMPDWGIFKFYQYKNYPLPTRIPGSVGGEYTTVKRDVNMIKFSIDFKLRNYIRKWK